MVLEEKQPETPEIKPTRTAVTEELRLAVAATTGMPRNTIDQICNEAIALIVQLRGKGVNEQPVLPPTPKVDSTETEPREAMDPHADKYNLLRDLQVSQE
ncbi:hypothetical protein COV81_03975 [Candidatus Peregrinibacteria bacterium CG11_big_fil_rev_8_21_14_0_20_41_10]|nr:MAG: hypothetical protein COV81_03975 [Candidatus Peregrinibacteria bacterium CG11_big_fil_rev_8_21_14_0_20_41_10]PIZ72908.1 MAG: hypothetical protein COY06_06060 [Candidatus Peregrinibacteria bacterium CG_4_10_14_0_2_um_filter_41_8]PJC38206.1 MAG: hypothetical protein CO045_01455 [Candidatus Peregrinibacteria bacterium CG_4_9_14_0_2_um_filter_41_14]